jgi:hypothetical protein
MNKRLTNRLLAGAIACCAGASPAAEGISTAKDLTAVIALHGQPCGQVTNAVKQGDNDYLATCENGARYRVFVNAEGRVVVQKR